MVSSGVPDELPEEVTLAGFRKEARQGQLALVKRLGERLGISDLGGRTSAATTSIGGSALEARQQEQVNKRREEMGQDPLVYPRVPGVKIR